VARHRCLASLGVETGIAVFGGLLAID
jgi:hypothetical protein